MSDQGEDVEMENNEHSLGDEGEDFHEAAEAEFGISQKISQSERLIQQRIFEHVDELGGLEIGEDLCCDLEDHDNEKILMVCTSQICDAPRRLCCGYCNVLHASHVKQVKKLQTFREDTLHSRVELQNTLAKFTGQQKKELVQGLLLRAVREKQAKLLQRFQKFQQEQYSSVVKLLDGATESYLFDEMAVMKTVAGFHQKVDVIFAKQWPELRKEQIAILIKLHENLPEFIEPLEKLDENRERLSRKMVGMIEEIFEKCEDNVQNLEFQCEGQLQDVMVNVYKDNSALKTSKPNKSNENGFMDLADQAREGASASVSSIKNVVNAPLNGSTVVQRQLSSSNKALPLSQQSLHSVLLKDGNAPKLGWKILNKLPEWAQHLKFVEHWNKKSGLVKKSQKDLPGTMDFTFIGPLEDTRGEIYVGQWRQGLRWGHGMHIQRDGTSYEGAWQKSKMEGHGRKVFRNGNMYEGDFKEDRMCGKGIYYHMSGSKYEGEWKEDQPHGRGVELMINNDVFEGEFKKGMRDGSGVLKGKDGTQIIAVWREGKIQGQGEQIYPDGRHYRGEFKEDKKEGEGSLTWPDKRMYQGPWVKGKQHGIGFFSNPDGSKVKGEWINGNRIRWISQVVATDK